MSKTTSQQSTFMIFLFKPVAELRKRKNKKLQKSKYSFGKSKCALYTWNNCKAQWLSTNFPWCLQSCLCPQCFIISIKFSFLLLLFFFYYFLCLIGRRTSGAWTSESREFPPSSFFKFGTTTCSHQMTFLVTVSIPCRHKCFISSFKPSTPGRIQTRNIL